VPLRQAVIEQDSVLEHARRLRVALLQSAGIVLEPGEELRAPNIETVRFVVADLVENAERIVGGDAENT
jgi:hypothetical protein